jgi:DNA-binding response OmpR family regulator
VRILLVEPDVLPRFYIKTFLTSHGHEVFATEDSETGLQTYMNNSEYYQVVILDLYLSSLSGAYFIDRVRDVNQNTKIIVTTGSTNDPKVEQYYSSISAFIQKPVDLNILKVTLEKLS